jgi:riboflavin kinase / FMN adenylyltransferase
MQIARLTAKASLGGPRPAVTVGNFDGVHRGHQALVAETVRRARERGGPATVLTFEPHPARVLDPARAPRALMTLDQKAEVLAGLEVDRLAVLPFTPELAAEPPDTFARAILGVILGAEVVVVGDDFRFGHDRAGDAGTLRGLGAEQGFEVVTVAAVLHEGSPISSSRVRALLAARDVRQAGVLLGRRYFIDGTVVRGEGRGRTLGIPTANLFSINEMLPGLGVYAALVTCPETVGPPRRGVVNVGRRPTFGGGDVTVEAHLLDFEGDLYGHPARVEFAHFLRGEQGFDSVGALKARIGEDIALARHLLGTAI